MEFPSGTEFLQRRITVDNRLASPLLKYSGPSSEKVPGERTNPRGNNTGADYRLDLIAIAVPPRDCAAVVNNMRSRPMEEDGEPKQTVDQQTK